MATSDMETRFHTFALTIEGAEAIDNLLLDNMAVVAFASGQFVRK